MSTHSATSSGVRLSELMGALSLSSDLGLEQPMEHVLRSCLIAVRPADRIGLSAELQAETYWVTLLATACTGESHEFAQLFGDDIAFRAGLYTVGSSTHPAQRQDHDHRHARRSGTLAGA